MRVALNVKWGVVVQYGVTHESGNKAAISLFFFMCSMKETKYPGAIMSPIISRRNNWTGRSDTNEAKFKTLPRQLHLHITMLNPSVVFLRISYYAQTEREGPFRAVPIRILPVPYWSSDPLLLIIPEIKNRLELIRIWKGGNRLQCIWIIPRII